jgi:F-type H+-transporting ATPase subunit gamma
MGKKVSSTSKAQYPIRARFDTGQNPTAKEALKISEELLSTFLAGETMPSSSLPFRFAHCLATECHTLVPFGR